MPEKQARNRANGQFKKGHSGNPNGRPPKIKCIPDILKAIGEEEGTLDGKTKLDVIMYKVFQYALEGKPWAVQFIADRTEGKAKEYVETKVIKDELIVS
tara:strand:+ start:22 stop:318 length:297 start_codon:yes stop_codon:yes gene_type:complete